MEFAEYFAEKRQFGKASLRRRQWKLAQGGDKTMLVWLGKNWLGQTDKLNVESKQAIDAVVKVTYQVPDNGRGPK